MTNFIDFNIIEPKLQLLIDRHKEILQEYQNNQNLLEYKDFTKEQDYSIKYEHRGYPVTYQSYFKAKHREFDKNGWHVSPLIIQGQNYSRNSEFLPILTKTLLEINLLSVCAINVLDSGIGLNWHTDKDYIPGVKLLRILWGLDVPEQDNIKSIIQIKNSDGLVETKEFKNGEFYIFHPLSEHRVENFTSQSRSILCIDYIADPERAFSIL